MPALFQIADQMLEKSYGGKARELPERVPNG